MHLTATLLASAAGTLIAVNSARLGTAQDMTFAIPIGVFMALALLFLFWLRSGHERAQREVQVREQQDRERSQERSHVLQAHELPAGSGEQMPR